MKHKILLMFFVFTLFSGVVVAQEIDVKLELVEVQEGIAIYDLFVETEEPTEFAGVQAVIQHDPTQLEFIGAENGNDYQWIASGIFGGTINEDISDGDFLWAGLSNFEEFPQSPMWLARLRFNVLEEQNSCVTISEEWCVGGGCIQTGVAAVGGADITGEITDACTASNDQSHDMRDLRGKRSDNWLAPKRK